MLNSEKAKIVTPMLIAMQMQKKVNEQTNYYWDYIKVHQTIDYTLKINDTYTYKFGHFITNDEDMGTFFYDPVGYATSTAVEIVVGNGSSTQNIGVKRYTSPPGVYWFLFETVNLYKNGELIATWFEYFDQILYNAPNSIRCDIFRHNYTTGKYYIKSTEVTEEQFNAEYYSSTPHEWNEIWWYYPYHNVIVEETSCNFTASGDPSSSLYLNVDWTITAAVSYDLYGSQYIGYNEIYPDAKLVYNSSESRTYTRRETSVYLTLSSSNPIFTFTPLSELQQDINNIQKYIYEEIEHPGPADFDVKLEDVLKIVPSP